MIDLHNNQVMKKNSSSSHSPSCLSYRCDDEEIIRDSNFGGKKRTRDEEEIIRDSNSVEEKERRRLLLGWRLVRRSSSCGIIRSQQQQQVNDDLLFFHILPRLPVKSLLRFSCVSKRWHTLVHDDPTFVQTQLNHSKANSNSSCLAIFASDFEVRFLNLDDYDASLDDNDNDNVVDSSSSNQQQQQHRQRQQPPVAFQTHTVEQHASHCTPPERIVCECEIGSRNSRLYKWRREGHPALFISVCDGYRCYPPTINFHHPYAVWKPETLVGTCNGLTCITTTTIKFRTAKRRIHILNHSTRELISIPKPKDPDDVVSAVKISTYNFGFGYDSLKNEYKIVVLISCTTRTCCMIYSLGTCTSSNYSCNNSNLCCWRDISDACPPMEVRRCYHPLLSNGGLFWVQGHGDDGNRIGQLVRFDIHSEEFQVIEAPRVPNNLWYNSLIEVGGKPSLWYCDVNADKLHFYSMMMDSGDNSNQVGQSYYWIKGSFTLGFPADAKDLMSAIHLVESSSKQILMQWLNANGQFTVYNPHSEKRQHVLAMDALDPSTYSKRKADTILLVNPVENLLSLKSLLTTDAPGIEYVSSREAPYRLWFGKASPLNYRGTRGYMYYNFR